MVTATILQLFREVANLDRPPPRRSSAREKTGDKSGFVQSVGGNDAER